MSAATDAAPLSPSEAKGKAEKGLSWVVRAWLKILDTMTSTFLGGPRIIKFAHVINLQKGSTFFVCLALMRKTGNFSSTATVYTALHGGYGFVWLLKELVFPDPKWQTYMTVGSAAAAFGAVLGPYWIIAYKAIAEHAVRSDMALCGATIMYVLGLVLMIGSDCQKHFVLKKQKGLITDGFFARVRHPNYLGEMVVYGSFAYVSCSMSSWLILASVWGGLFLPYMLRKEVSMSRYSSWTAYKARTGFLIPRLFVRTQPAA